MPSPFITYRYAVFRGANIITQEQGFSRYEIYNQSLNSRICDVKLLKIKMTGRSDLKQGKVLESYTLVDSWNFYTIRFSMFYPLEPCEAMYIKGDFKKNFDHDGAGYMGKNQDSKPLVYELNVRQRTLSEEETKENKGAIQFKYNYMIACPEKEYNIWDRQPQRIMNIADPKDYKGVPKISRSNFDTVFIVNGRIE